MPGAAAEGPGAALGSGALMTGGGGAGAAAGGAAVSELAQAASNRAAPKTMLRISGSFVAVTMPDIMRRVCGRSNRSTIWVTGPPT